MTDLAKTIAPKSDQLNADDLIAGDRTITITKVTGSDDPDQPISIHFEGDERKPYKPCKSMRRVMVHAWGPDGNSYPGKRLTLFCDPNVMFGGIKVGGIRISHMSHIDREMVIPLTITRAKRSPFAVRPLRAEVVQKPAVATSTMPLRERADAFLKRVGAASTPEKINAIWAAAEALRADLDTRDPELLAEVTAAWEARRAEIDDPDRAPF